MESFNPHQFLNLLQDKPLETEDGIKLASETKPTSMSILLTDKAEFLDIFIHDVVVEGVQPRGAAIRLNREQVASVLEKISSGFSIMSGAPSIGIELAAENVVSIHSKPKKKKVKAKSLLTKSKPKKPAKKPAKKPKLTAVKQTKKAPAKKPVAKKKTAKPVKAAAKRKLR